MVLIVAAPAAAAPASRLRTRQLSAHLPPDPSARAKRRMLREHPLVVEQLDRQWATLMDMPRWMTRRQYGSLMAAGAVQP